MSDDTTTTVPTPTTKQPARAEIVAMSDAEVRTFAEDLFQENTRLRRILTTLAQANEGQGAVMELYAHRHDKTGFSGVVVCRADRDEKAFLADFEVAAAELFARVGLVRTGPSEGKGTSRESFGG